ncbi:MAG TPA: hypothetical protein VM912_02455 [Terriglobales bacterium]|nr:hypothetical protein [Terriglobales bacterium]
MAKHYCTRFENGFKTAQAKSVTATDVTIATVAFVASVATSAGTRGESRLRFTAKGAAPGFLCGDAVCAYGHVVGRKIPIPVCRQVAARLRRLIGKSQLGVWDDCARCICHRPGDPTEDVLCLRTGSNDQNYGCKD